MNSPLALKTEIPAQEFLVVHPLDDAPEQKRNADKLGLMAITPAVKWSLVSLRAYLVLMTLMLAYHLCDLAGLFRHAAK